MARAGAALLALVLAVGAAGCGEEEGVAEGATVRVYAEAPLCKASEGAQIATTGGPDVAIELVCLPDPLAAGKLDLARAGANARRATEDSAAVAYLETDDPEVSRFTHPVLEAAGIAWITADSRAAAMRQLLPAITDADSGSLRAAVRDSLE